MSGGCRATARRARGLALVEALAATAIVGALTVTSAALLVRGRAIARRVGETRVAAEAVAAELAAARAGLPRAPSAGTRAWSTPPPAGLPGACGDVTVAPVEGIARLVRVRVELSWDVDRSLAREVLVEVGP